MGPLTGMVVSTEAVEALITVTTLDS